MRLLAELLMVTAALGILGTAGAEIIEPAAGDAPGSRPVVVDLSLYSFAEIADLPAGAEHRLLAGDAFQPLPDMTLAGLSSATAAAPAQPARAHVAAPPKGSVLTLNAATDDLPGVAAGEDFSAAGAKPADSRAGALLPFSTMEIPEPGDWMMLLCVVAVAGFMARRKR